MAGVIGAQPIFEAIKEENLAKIQTILGTPPFDINARGPGG